MPDERSINTRKARPSNERQACEIRIRAERRAGELLKDLQKAVGARTDLQPQANVDQRLTKAEQIERAGLTEKQAKTFQRLAAVPEQTFEQELAQQERPTTSGIIRAAEPLKQPSV